MLRPKSIRLFLAEGDPNGLIVATIPNWSGSVILGRNADLPSLLNRPEANLAGAYILLGDDPSSILTKKCYIGKAANLKSRLKTQAREKEWWDSAAIISTADSNFSTAHFEQLESSLIQLANTAKIATVENSSNPVESAGQLGEADAAAVQAFLDDLKLVLPVLGIDMFRIAPKLPSLTNTDGTENLERTLFELTNRGVTLAHAVLLNADFIVLADSRALKDPGHASNQYAQHRERLIEKGLLYEDGEYFRFKEDVVFSSPSKAAAIVLDRNANGRTEWKTNGMNFGDWQDLQTPND